MESKCSVSVEQEKTILTMNDYQILAIMHQKKFDAPLKSITYMELVNETKLSINKIRKTINQFLKLGYVKEGLKQINAKRFYITSDGTEKVLKSIKCK